MTTRTCKCGAEFEPEFSNQRSCSDCRKKEATRKRQARLEQRKKNQDAEKIGAEYENWDGPPRPPKEIYFYELQRCREFLCATGDVDVRPGETLRQLAKRCYELRLGCGRKLNNLYRDHGYVVLNESFTGCSDNSDPSPDEPIDTGNLPELPELRVYPYWISPEVQEYMKQFQAPRIQPKRESLPEPIDEERIVLDRKRQEFDQEIQRLSQKARAHLDEAFR